jgi:molybdopterin converting factor small subunit
MPSVQVLLFARYAELLGRSRLSIELDQVATVGALVSRLRGLPGGNSLPERPFVAINLKQAEFDQRLAAGDEVAVLPPMAGG